MQVGRNPVAASEERLAQVLKGLHAAEQVLWDFEDLRAPEAAQCELCIGVIDFPYVC